MSPRKWQHKLLPHDPADYDEDVVYAVDAWRQGTANDGQQRLAYEWVMYVCGIDDWAYRPESAGPGARDVVLGKQFVGRTIRKMSAPEVLDWARRENEKAARAARTVAMPQQQVKPRRRRK